MKRKKSSERMTGIEVALVAVLVIALTLTGVIGVGFNLNELFASVRFPQ